MYPILLSVGPIHIFSLSVFLILAWSAWSFLFWRHLRAEGVGDERIFTLMFSATVVVFVASRAGFVATHWHLFSDNLLKIVALWVQPGLSLYSGITAALVTLF